MHVIVSVSVVTPVVAATVVATVVALVRSEEQKMKELLSDIKTSFSMVVSLAKGEGHRQDYLYSAVVCSIGFAAGMIVACL